MQLMTVHGFKGLKQEEPVYQKPNNKNSDLSNEKSSGDSDLEYLRSTIGFPLSAPLFQAGFNFSDCRNPLPAQHALPQARGGLLVFSRCGLGSCAGVGAGALGCTLFHHRTVQVPPAHSPSLPGLPLVPLSAWAPPMS